MIVMKFGGTSVGSAERLLALAERVHERRQHAPMVVVSALSGVTDALLRGAHDALRRDARVHEARERLEQRHLEVVRALALPEAERERLRAHVALVLGELETLYMGVHYLGDLSPRSLDAVAAVGERLSCELAAAALISRGVPAQAVDAREIIATDADFGRAAPDTAAIAARAEARLRPLLDAGRVPVMGGFIGATREGVTTTLGRGGSDWSAALVGAALGADEIQIWTDVDGILTVDPRLIPSARVIPEIGFEEAAELAYFGAKVLHPATIKPAIERGIPVRVLNSLRPEAAGTLISAEHAEPAGEPRALAFKRGISVLLVSQPRMLMAHGFVARVFEAFARQRTSVDLIATSEVSISLTIDDPARLPAIREELESLADVQVLDDMAIVSVVGRGFVRRAGLAARIFQALRPVNVVMISFGASDVNLSVVVAGADAERAVRLLHAEFFEATA
jgi:aspartate kinase